MTQSDQPTGSEGWPQSNPDRSVGEPIWNDDPQGRPHSYEQQASDGRVGEQPHSSPYPSFGQDGQQPSYGQRQPEGLGSPFDPTTTYPQQPTYGQPTPYAQQPPPGQPSPNAQQWYGQPYAQQGYGQPYAQQPYGQQPPGRPTPYGQQGWVPPQPPGDAKRPMWKTVVGWIFVVLTGLMVLSAVSQLANGRPSGGGGGVAYNVGYLIGVVLIIGLPGLIAWLLLRRKP